MRHWISKQRIIFQILIPISIILVVTGLILTWLTGVWIQGMVNREIEGDIIEMGRQVLLQTETLKDDAANIAALFSNLPEVIKAYRQENEDRARMALLEEIRPIAAKYNQERGRDQLRVHFHKPPARSFLRAWWKEGENTAKIGGDDLSGFRETVKEISSLKKPLSGVEVGRAGLVIRSLSPVSDQGRYLGSVEMFYNFSQVIERIKVNDSTRFALFLDVDKARLAVEGGKGRRVGGFMEVSLGGGRDEAALNPDDKDLKQGLAGLHWTLTPGRAVGYLPIADFRGDPVGVLVYEMDASLREVQGLEVRRNLMLSLLALLVVLSSVYLLVVRGNLILPIKRVSRFAGRINAGDHSEQLPAKLLLPEDEAEQGKVHNELRIMGGALNKMLTELVENEKRIRSQMDALRSVLGKVGGVSDRLAVESEQIRDSAASLSQGAAEQAASLEQVSSSMIQVEAQTSTNADNSAEANRLITQVRASADQGARQMDSMQEAMAEINESSHEIDKIIKTIDEIAFQTNLLALNAAVEAARAGKHGQGFAVVAQEVRNLAGRSARAAQETAAMIELNVKRVEKGAETLSHTAESLDEIVEGAVQMSDLIGQIAMASQEQAQGIGQINQGLRQVELVTQKDSAFAEQTASASESLADLVDLLRQTMNQFNGGERHESSVNEKKPPEVHRLNRRTPPLIENQPQTEFISWSDRLSVGVGELDRQHQELVRLINELYDALKSGQGKEVLVRILDGLVDYTRVHFATEEKYFKRYNYPETEQHAAEHRSLVEQVLGFKRKMESGQDMISVSLLNFLKGWLIDHIQETDRKYGPFLNRHGLS